MSGSTDSQALVDAVWFYVLFTLVLCGDVALRSPARHVAARNIRRVIWKKMLRIRMDYYDGHNPSDLMSTMTNDATTATEYLVEFLVAFSPRYTMWRQLCRPSPPTMCADGVGLSPPSSEAYLRSLCGKMAVQDPVRRV